MKNTDYILSLLNELPPDFEKIENELKLNSFNEEELATIACNFAEECFLELRDFVHNNNRQPEDNELHSTYIYDICKLLLKYGLNPNTVIGEKYNEDNIMNRVCNIDKPYVAADTLRLLLENGGNPYNETEPGFSLFHDIDFDICFDVTEGYANADFYKNLFDCRFHCYLVLQGFTADDENPDDVRYKNHEQYTYRIEKKDDSHWDLLTIKLHGNPEQ